MRKRIISFVAAIAMMCAVFLLTATMAFAATALKITKQPAAVTVTSGSTAKVTVTAKGDGLGYKWYYKDKGASKFKLDKKKKSKAYSVTMTSKVNGRKVYCVVTDKNGKTVKSKTVTLGMYKTPKITKQPANVKAASGKTVKVSLKAQGEGLTYKWYYKNKGASKFKLDKSSKTATYSVKMSKSVNGRKVYCVVTDKNGRTVKSNEVTLSLVKTVTITKQPTNMKAASGKTVKISLKAEGNGLTYKWYYKNKGASKFKLDKSSKTATYSVKMSKSVDGRKVYCVVTDKNGKTAKSNEVTLSLANAVKITNQPSSATVDCGATAKLTVAASGDGLTYKWYYQNSGDSKYTVDNKNNSNTYSEKMTSSVNGRKVYCVIKDAYGETVQTKTVKLSLKHVYDNGTVSKKATCLSTGEKTYTCKGCNLTKKETLAKTDHSYEGWKTYIEATVTEKGVERNKCKTCTYYKDRYTDKLKVVYYITVNTGSGSAQKIGVASNGKYSLSAPSKVGYNFKGWKDSSGNAFAASGVCKKNVTVTAQWELDGTNTLAELVERTDAGVSEIKITGNITVNKAIFISTQTKIYSDADYTIKRDPSYKGDIFVVGRDKNGKISSVEKKNAVLNLGGGKGTLTIDGNRDKLKVDVVGSAVFVGDSSVVNIYDGVKIVNNKKTGNERALTYKGNITGSVVEKAGGAALLILNSTANIYGGVMDNNIVATEYTVVENEDGTTSNLETNGCGGAVFNLGNINMYGGTISNNEALRGGGIYSAKVLYLISGKISGNTGYVYGGGVASSSGGDSEIYIGEVGNNKEMLFEGNHSRVGGALYSNTSSPILVAANARFKNNTSTNGGGAIYTAGTLTVNGSVFEGNSTDASGGAIYHYYTKATFERRDIELTDCVFKNNSASLGGAVALSASDSVSETGLGTYAEITNCTFTENKAVKNESNVGNGGAIYITRKSESIISGCSFTGNTAANIAGAVAVQSSAKLTLSDSSFTGNQSTLGGAINAAEGTVLDMKNVSFTDNKAVTKESGSNGTGGALYLYNGQANFENVDFEGNSAENHAGAVYLGVSDITIDSSCSFKGNSAVNHGGAFYLTYKTNSDQTRDGAVLDATGTVFENNTAMAGGAISIRSDCEANLNNVTLKNNSVEGYDNNKADGDGEGGGAIYVGYGSLNLTNVTATGNTASDFGGVIDAAGSEVTVNGGTFTGNKSNNGGFIHGCSNSKVTVTGATVKENESVYVNSDYNNAIGGGAVSMNGGELAISATTFDGNKSDYYGGTVHAKKATVKIDGNTTFENSQGGTGAALYFSGSSNVELENIAFNNNKSRANGVIYASGGTLNIKNVAATGNSAVNGGIIYISGGAVANISENTWNGSSATKGGIAYVAGATANVNNCTFEENTANIGGVIYVEKGTLNTTNVKFIKNKALKTESGSYGNGGAVSMSGGTFNVSSTDIFTENTAENHGGAVYVSYFEETNKSKTGAALIANGGLFSKNSAMGGGAISIRSNSSAVLTGTTLSENSVKGYADKNDGDGEGGGAVYVGYGSLTLNNVNVNYNSSESSGGAIDVFHSTLVAEGGSFSGNSSDLDGGAIYLSTASQADIKDADFVSNTAKQGAGVFGYNSTSVALKNISFEGNNATANGGGLFLYNVPVTTENIDFTSNTTDGNGGAVYVCGTAMSIDSESKFLNNSAKGHGGAIYHTYKTVDGKKVGETLEIGATTFENNTAMAGGAISIRSECKAVLNSTNLIGNSVAGFTDTSNNGDGEGGGAVYVGYGSLEMNGVTATGNTASDFGGAVDAAGAKEVIVTGGTFTGNTSYSGGAIFGTSSVIKLSGVSFSENKSVFEQNSAEYKNDIGGGAVNVKYGSIDIQGSTFDANESKYYGGTIHAYKATVDISGNTTVSNSKGATGAALYLANSCTTTIENTSLISNKSSSNGVLYLNGGKLDMTNVTATDNSAYNGGVMYATSATVTLKDSTWSSNKATFGGAIFNNGATVTVTGGEIKENIANNGGAAYVKGGTLNAEGATFLKNSANKASNKYGYGGAVALESGTFNVSGNSTFTENTAENNGGVFYFSGTVQVSIEDSTFENNTAVSYGGVLDHRSSKKLTVKNSTFKGNSAGISGGAIHANAEVEVTNCTFENNSANAENNSDTIARGGGAIFVRSGKTVTVNGGTFTTNNAAGTTDDKTTDAGGAILVDGGTLNATGAAFNSNTAYNGGAIGTSKSPDTVMNITNCSFTGNTGTKNGAGVYVQNGVIGDIDTIVIKGCSFTNNTVKESSGSAVYIRTLSSAKIVDLTATGGKVSWKGCVYATSGARVTLEGTVSLGEGEEIFVTGKDTTTGTISSAIVNYTSEAEKTAWANEIVTASGATVTYVSKA